MLALNLKPEYSKALNRAAVCSFYIKDYNLCIEFCDKLLNQTPADKEILNLRTDALVARVRNVNKYICTFKFRL